MKAGRKAKDGDQPLTEYLVFFSNTQLDRLAELAAASSDKVDSAPRRQHSPRLTAWMLLCSGAWLPTTPISTSMPPARPAHAISTHAVATEFDYYTAVDDENPKEETGA